MENKTVTICTPTYNRRKFLPYLIKCVENQTYPKRLIEWIVIDDGEDCVQDLFDCISYVKYFRLNKRIKLGAKRNLLHEKSTGEIIINMDDDDYYPPDRIKHVVEMLSNNKCLIAGLSKIYCYFSKINKIYQFGPYRKYHSTAATFGFKRELLKYTTYENDAECAEEKIFLKNYTIPLIQLNPIKTILVFAHSENTFDKYQLIENAPTKYVKVTDLKLEDFITNREMREFYRKQ